MAITDWPEDERPRERLLAQGAQALSDAELLAIFLRVGIKRQERGRSGARPARPLRRQPGPPGRRASRRNSPSVTRHRPGQGGATRGDAGTGSPRRCAKNMQRRDLLGSPGAVRDWLRLKLARPAARSLRRALARRPEPPDRRRGTVPRHADPDQRLSARGRQAGPGPQCRRRDPRPQPSHPVSPNPPRADELLTRNLKQALALVDVRVLDHFIVAGTASRLSFAERGLV